MQGKGSGAHAFVRKVMEQLGVENARDLARALGVAETDEEVKVGRWVRGAGAPNFEGTMALLRAAGWLREEAELPAAAVGAAVSNGPRPGSPEALLVGLMDEVREGFQKLDRRMARLEQRLPVSVPQAPPRRRRAG